VRGCGPRRANSGSSWLRTSTLTEGWSWVGETLRRERDAASLGQREPFRCHVGGATDQSATAMVTELMTTGVRGRSL